MLTIWALGASPETIQLQYEREDKRQRPAFPRDEKVIASFADKDEFMKCMFQEEHYSNYLAFFQHEIATKGVPAVMQEYLFGGDKLAESLLSRMFAGLVHPIIHLGFGIEFKQPAIIAQALAQASVHQDYLSDQFFNPASVAATASPLPAKTLMQIMEEMREDEVIRNASAHGDTDVFEDGILKRADETVIQHCSKWSVPEDKISEKLAEMVNTAGKLFISVQHMRCGSFLTSSHSILDCHCPKSGERAETRLFLYPCCESLHFLQGIHGLAIPKIPGQESTPGNEGPNGSFDLGIP